MIRLGPAGIPTISSGRGTLEGLKALKEIELNAMEIEFVRGIYLTKKNCKPIKELAEHLDIKLSIHAPYFINLLSEKAQTVKQSINKILQCLEIGEELNSEFVVVHSAYYGKLSKEEAFEKMIEVTKEILEKAKEIGIKNSKLAYETMAKESQFADLDTLLNFYKKIKSKNFTICVDFAHIFVRNNGKIDYGEIFDKLEKAGINYIHSHFEGVKYNLNTKKFVDVHVEMDSNPPFEPLAKEILKRKVDITIISESPILEQDSLKMKKIFEKLGYKF